MTRLIFVLCLALVLSLAPAAGAKERPGSAGEGIAFSRWFEPLWEAMDWLVSRLPTFRSTTENVGAMIDPGAIIAPPVTAGAVPNGRGIPPQGVGAMISPSG